MSELSIRELGGSLPAPARSPAAPAAAASPAPAVPAAAPLDRARLMEAVDRANRLISGTARNLIFRIDQESGKAVVEVVDTETGSLVRQIPSEEMVAISRALDRMQGLMIHLKV